MSSMDSLSTFLPGISEDEREKRLLLSKYRNAASALIASTESDNARCLAWMVNEYVTGALFAPGAAAELDDLNRLCKRLMITAVQIEMIDLERFAA